VDGKLYGVIPSFKDHQTLSSMKHEQERYPTPPEHFQDMSRTGHGHVQDEEGKEGKGKGKGNVKVKEMSEPSAQFERFFEKYPKKDQRKNAIKVWSKLKLDAQADAVMSRLEVMLPELRRREKQYIPLAHKWLEAEDFSVTVPRAPEQAEPEPDLTEGESEELEEYLMENIKLPSDDLEAARVAKYEEIIARRDHANIQPES
jgi:hypothetical protein